MLPFPLTVAMGNQGKECLHKAVFFFLKNHESANLPDPGMEPTSLVSPALTGMFFSTSATWEALKGWYIIIV